MNRYIQSGTAVGSGIDLRSRMASRSLPSFRTKILIGLLTCGVLLGGPLKAAEARGPSRGRSIPPREFQIVSPGFGSYNTGEVSVSLQYVTENETPVIQVELNGRKISDTRFDTSCQGTICTVTGQLTTSDGLRVGENRLMATLAGRLRQPTFATTSSTSTPVLVQRTKFDYFENLSAGQYNTMTYYNPISIGLATLPNGGGPSANPWLQLTTGYPADFNATADAYAFPNLPGPKDQNGNPTTINYVTIPNPDLTEGFTCTGAAFQAYVLGHQNPYQGGPNDKNVETGACFNNISELQSAFQGKFNRPLGTQDLVIMGTAPGQTVPPGFDASPLGGTNFSQTPAATYPQAYIMIGVPGTSAGTAYENFSITPTDTHPDSNIPTLNGTLMKDQYNNYNFVPSGNAEFVVHSDASTGSYIKVGNKTFTPPEALTTSGYSS
jgi:hypothetical protein